MSGPEVELLYFYSSDCGACQKFDAEVGSIYPKTAEARIIPLRKVRYDKGVGQRLRLEKPIIGTPTFVLQKGKRELDRITGYSNDELFWLAMRRLANQI